jgi:hypothetical protein
MFLRSFSHGHGRQLEVAACRKADVRFSIATGINPSITKAIATVPPDA